MKSLAATCLLILLSACGAPPSGTRAATCQPSATQSPLGIQDGNETADYPSVALVMSGPRVGNVSKCTGTIVGHNSLLTAAHCIQGAADSISVIQTSGLRGSEHERALASAISPRAIVSHGPFYVPPGGIDLSQLPEDLVVLIFRDRVFQQRDVLIPSIHDMTRPVNFTETFIVGFGKSHPGDSGVDSIKRVGKGFYLVHEILGRDVIFSYNRQLDSQTFAPVGPKKYSQALQGDSGGPLFVKQERHLSIVGVTSASGMADDGLTSQSVFVDLFSERSLSLLRRAIQQGAKFTSPAELRESTSISNTGAPPTATCLMNTIDR